jgi:hypothetical protein
MNCSLARVCSLSCFTLAAPLAAQATWSRTPTVLAPSARQNHAAAYDFARGRLVLFSGITFQGDTWELAGATWTQRTPAQSPSGRIGHWMAYDIGRSRVVLFGGSTTGNDFGAVGDTWEWDGTNWTQRFPAQAPSARWAHAMTADWANGRVVLFGGRDTASVHQNDTWAWDGTNWTLLATTGPSPRCCFDIVQDITRGRIVLFGGWNQGDRGDTWEFDGVAWQQVQPVNSPSARWGHRMCYDIARNQLILNGGDLGGAETWQWDGITWTLIDTTLDRLNSAIHYDWQIGRATLFGGTSTTMTSFLDATWTFGVASPATVAPFGSACAGPMGTPQLGVQGAGLPWIGTSFTLRAQPVSAFAMFLFGWSNTVSGSLALPYSLAPHGAPACSVLVSPDAVFGVAAGASTATIVVPVPFAPALVGMQFFNQAVSFDAGANPLGLTVSNGTTATIGWQ